MNKKWEAYLASDLVCGIFDVPKEPVRFLYNQVIQTPFLKLI